MPTYEYECRECNYQFESFQWMEDRKKPEKEVCTKCGKKKIKLGYVSQSRSLVFVFCSLHTCCIRDSLHDILKSVRIVWSVDLMIIIHSHGRSRSVR